MSNLATRCAATPVNPDVAKRYHDWRMEYLEFELAARFHTRKAPELHAMWLQLEKLGGTPDTHISDKHRRILLKYLASAPTTHCPDTHEYQEPTPVVKYANHLLYEMVKQNTQVLTLSQADPLPGHGNLPAPPPGTLDSNHVFNRLKVACGLDPVQFTVPREGVADLRIAGTHHHIRGHFQDTPTGTIATFTYLHSLPGAGTITFPEEDQDQDNLVLASLGERSLGAFFDFIISFLLTLGLVLFTGGFTQFKQGQLSIQQTIFYTLVGIAIFLLIHGYLLYTRGQTIGKLCAGTRIVDMDGNLPDPGSIIFLRHIIPVIVIQIPLIGNFLGLIDGLFIFNQDRRCLHDHLAGTQVIKVPPQLDPQ